MSIKILLILPLLYDPFVGKDKTKHFGASCIIAQATYIKTHSVAKTIFLSTSIGVAKEIYDLKIKKTKFSTKDLLWDFAGTLTGIFIQRYY